MNKTKTRQDFPTTLRYRYYMLEKAFPQSFAPIPGRPLDKPNGREIIVEQFKPEERASKVQQDISEVFKAFQTKQSYIKKQSNNESHISSSFEKFIIGFVDDVNQQRPGTHHEQIQQKSHEESSKSLSLKSIPQQVPSPSVSPQIKHQKSLEYKKPTEQQFQQKPQLHHSVAHEKHKYSENQRSKVVSNFFDDQSYDEELKKKAKMSRHGIKVQKSSYSLTPGDQTSKKNTFQMDGPNLEKQKPADIFQEKLSKSTAVPQKYQKLYPEPISTQETDKDVFEHVAEPVQIERDEQKNKDQKQAAKEEQISKVYKQQQSSVVINVDPTELKKEEKFSLDETLGLDLPFRSGKSNSLPRSNSSASKKQMVAELSVRIAPQTKPVVDHEQYNEQPLKEIERLKYEFDLFQSRSNKESKQTRDEIQCLKLTMIQLIERVKRLETQDVYKNEKINQLTQQNVETKQKCNILIQRDQQIEARMANFVSNLQAIEIELAQTSLKLKQSVVKIQSQNQKNKLIDLMMTNLTTQIASLGNFLSHR